MPKERTAYTDNQNTLLFNEVDGFCPKCNTQLMNEKDTGLFRAYEIAHIYPLNPTSHDRGILEGQEPPEKINGLENLILLCPSCHDKYDKGKTLEEYLEMKEIKNRIVAKHDSKKLWPQFGLETEIRELLDLLISGTGVEDETPLSYDPRTLDNKTDHTLKRLDKRMIRNNIREYFLFVQNYFKEQEKLKTGIGDLVSMEIKVWYKKMKQVHATDQSAIFQEVSNWINHKTGGNSQVGSDIIASFFVQNCEVFDDLSK